MIVKLFQTTGNRKPDTAQRSRRIRLLQVAWIALGLTLSACDPASVPPPVSESWQPVDDHGNELSIDQLGHHACVLDRRTHLLWEVKQDATGPQRTGATYSWYNEDRAVNLSDAGTPGAGDCDLDRCDTSTLVQAVNQAGLCGHHDWRLPRREELLTLGDPQRVESGRVLDPEFFPHQVVGEYWTDSTYRLYPQSAWVVDSGNGLDRAERKSEPRYVRLVRGAVFNPRKPAREEP
ncbi:MAG: DUF1566 domain-containing protein [Wenzhouxiangellaceae bacterium]